MTSRSWTWLVTRVTGLINHPTRVSRLGAAFADHTHRGGFDVT